MIDSISLAKSATERERDRKKQTASDLEKDRDAWVEDQQFAQAALERLNVRNSRLQKTIRDTRASIFDLRKELAELNGRLMAEGNRNSKQGKKCCRQRSNCSSLASNFLLEFSVTPNSYQNRLRAPKPLLSLTVLLFCGYPSTKAMISVTLSLRVYGPA